jgi:hypothetical protein
LVARRSQPSSAPTHKFAGLSIGHLHRSRIFDSGTLAWARRAPNAAGHAIETVAARRGAARLVVSLAARRVIVYSSGQIALHGTGNLSGALGTAASHGCVRFAPRAITWPARRIGAGVPVSIVAAA